MDDRYSHASGCPAKLLPIHAAGQEHEGALASSKVLVLRLRAKYEAIRGLKQAQTLET